MPKVIRVDPKKPDRRVIDLAIRVIRGGGTIIYPTDTVYGIGANALEPQSALKVFEIKERPLNQALPIAVSGLEMARKLAFIPDGAKKLIERFWPGALTIVLRKRPIVPSEVTGGGDRVGLRAPNHAVPLEIIENSSLPIIATSANKHGQPSPITVGEALRQIGESVELCLDAGRTEIQMPSTVLDFTKDPPAILRKGAISVRAIERTLGEVEVQSIP